jgi:hypothetical protein
MSRIAIWTALTVIVGLFLLIGVHAHAYAQDGNFTSMGNATNATTLGNATNSTTMGNTTTTSGELDQTGKTAGIPMGDGA